MGVRLTGTLASGLIWAPFGSGAKHIRTMLLLKPNECILGLF